MTKAVFCDRCEKLYMETYIFSGKISGFKLYPEGLELDLCSDCRDKLEDFIVSAEELREMRE